MNKFQYVVKRNTWFGAFPHTNEKYKFSIVGCTVSPGFEWLDFEIGNQDYLLNKYPLAESVIKKLTIK